MLATANRPYIHQASHFAELRKSGYYGEVKNSKNSMINSHLQIIHQRRPCPGNIISGQKGQSGCQLTCVEESGLICTQFTPWCIYLLGILTC
jgi:hypothetical protein